MKTYRIELPGETSLVPTDFVEVLETLHATLVGRVWAWEIRTYGQNLGLQFTADETTASVITGQLYAAYPRVEITEAPLKFPAEAVAEARLKRTDLYGLKPITDFTTDSLSSFLQVAAVGGASQTAGLQIICQVVADTAGSHLVNRGRIWWESIRQYARVKYWFKAGVRQHFAAHRQAKVAQRLFRVSVRVSAAGPSASERLQALQRSLEGLNTLDFNQLQWQTGGTALAEKVQHRRLGRSFKLTMAELAAVWHLPSAKTVPNLLQVLSSKGEPPTDLPIDIGLENSLFGITNFHGQAQKFGINRTDRQRHLYCVGKSGSGKSKFLEQLIQSDLEHGKGVAVLDPHGDLVDNVLRLLPPKRLEDVVIFDPADTNFPVSFNPLANVEPPLKMRVTIGFIEVFKRLFGVGWTPRLEHVLRYTTLALLDTPGASLVSVQQMLTDKNFRQSVVQNIQDDVVKNFWTQEFAAWSQKFDAEAITPLLNKVGQFVATNQIRNLVGQRDNALDFRRFMDERKVVLMKVSKGQLGEENAQLLGAMLVTKIYQAAMSRADVTESEREDFYFYVDEFQNFTTDTFDQILSEARKYRLNLTLAHQFLGQLPERIRSTVFGNVGAMVCFRTGGEDAKILAEELAPRFTQRDIINLGVRDFYCKMSVNGQLREAFSGRTLDVVFPSNNLSQAAREYSRKTYARPVEMVEKSLNQMSHSRGQPKLKPEPGFTEPLV